MNRLLAVAALVAATGVGAVPADPHVPPEPFNRNWCESNCIDASWPIRTCHAGRDRAEIEALEVLMAGSSRSPFSHLADKFVRECTKTCMVRGDPYLFRAWVGTSSRVPLMCRYEWTWCVDEDGPCQPAVPEIDEAAYFDRMVCGQAEGSMCLRPVQSGPFAGCHYVVLGDWSLWDDADFDGFQCKNGLLHGTGTVGHGSVVGGMYSEHRRLVQGFRTGWWTRRLTDAVGDWVLTERITYSVVAHGPFERQAYDGSIERGHLARGKEAP